jgi:hypothetical protein
MAMYEEYGFGQPDLEPMQDHCVKTGLGEGAPNENELQLVMNMF